MTSPETCFIIDIDQHKRKNLAKVIKFLSSRDMEGSIIFTEASNDEVKRKHPFYGGLSKFLSKQKAIEIHEPEYKASMKQAWTIYEDTLPSELRALRSSHFGWQPPTIVSEFDRYTQIICQVRDPIIAREITDNSPNYTIFGAGHIPGVLAILNQQVGLNIKVLHLTPAMVNIAN